MLIELHLLQNFAPANLNRDDTGAPKDCEFGGYRRARVSSQSWKRAIRQTFASQGLLAEGDLGVRTKRVQEELTTLLGAAGRDAATTAAVSRAALGALSLSLDDDGLTQYLLFVGRDELRRIAAVCDTYWDQLARIARPSADAGGKKGKAQRKDAVPAEVANALGKALGENHAPDVALFGRMVADLPRRNVDAAAQVAHALSTNQVSMEFDFYTAVDDLQPADSAGAGMMGTVEFNSACFYRYLNVDLAQLATNLGNGDNQARRTLEAYIRAAIASVPTGKQNSMAAHNPPSTILAVAREGGAWNLANAFLRPVRPSRDADLAERSLAALDAYWGKLAALYGTGQVGGAWVATLHPDSLDHLRERQVPGVDALVQHVVGAARFQAGPALTLA